MVDLWQEIVDVRARGEACALCTIVRTQGSTPGKERMKMLVRADGSFAGTVGGGCLEAEVLEAALEAMSDERTRILKFSLNERDYPDSGLMCGGQVEIFVEPICEAELFLFGGGHVSRAIARVASTAGFRVTVGDDREVFASPERHPDAHSTRNAPFAELARSIAPAERMYLISATRGHDQDGEVLRALHDAGCKPRYLGMIGSRAKRKVLFERLRGQGVGDSFLQQVRSPMGLDIGALTHGEIAVSVVAEMVAVRRRSGAVVGEPATRGDAAGA